MRQLIASAAIGLGLFVASAAAAQTPNIAGVWQLQGQIICGNRIVSGTPTCTFRQSGGRLSGECVGPNAAGPLAGFISGHKVAWTWSNRATTSVGITGKTGLNGTYVDSHLIRGTMTSSASACKGTFTQTR